MITRSLHSEWHGLTGKLSDSWFSSLERLGVAIGGLHRSGDLHCLGVRETFFRQQPALDSLVT